MEDLSSALERKVQRPMGLGAVGLGAVQEEKHAYADFKRSKKVEDGMAAGSP